MIASLFGARSGRCQLLLFVAAVALVASLLTRVALTAASDLLLELPGILVRGIVLDAAVIALALVPLGLTFSLGSGRWLRTQWFRAALLCAIVAAVVFGHIVEYFFFEEFDARFNHVALDYLLFPGEVAGNIWESYPVPLYVGLALFAGGLCAWAFNARVRAPAFPRLSWRERLARAAVVIATGCVALGYLVFMPNSSSHNRRIDEIESNGLVQLARAYKTASLDYSSYYRTVPATERGRTVVSELGWAEADDPQREFVAVERRSRPLDIVVVLSESFGSEFVGRLGGKRPNAPGLERWAEQGLLLTNVVPTGNRTVRGLEGVLCSFVPLPGDSIWKRDKSNDVASIARVLGAAGYRTEFVYGGDGAFDGMKSFAVRNGWQVFHEDALLGASSYPADAFRTIWGVADETMFTTLLERQRQAARDGTSFFGTALTVSNHKPFLTPDSTTLGLRGDKLVSAAIIGAFLALASFVAWRVFSRGARGQLVTVIGLAWIGFAIYAWTSAQPRDSRDAAVRYSDRAFAEYMDQAKAEGLLDHTVVLFVGDHGARVYGSEEIPASSYRVPALFVAPDAKYVGTTIPRLCSQIDLAPTLLSMAGVDYVAPFFGRDLLRDAPDGPGRAYLIHNRNIGLLTDTTLTVLGLQKTTTCYRRSDRASDVFVRVDCDAEGETRAERAAAVFESASVIYESRRYRLEHDP